MNFLWNFGSHNFNIYELFSKKNKNHDSASSHKILETAWTS